MTKKIFPELPYLGLAAYEAEQSLLFAGRDAHVDACGEILAQTDTRILLLHGQTGCGKSSFLRAGLIPALEDRGFGYVFLRTPTAAPENEGSPVFVRCGSDPLKSLARELYLYISAPVTLRTALGSQQFDLSSAALDCEDAAAFIDKCSEPEFLMKVLYKVSDLIPHTLVVVLDQMEEVLTLNAPDSDNRKRFFRFLKLFNNTGHHVKLILALRKDYSGEFIGLAQIENSVKAEFKTYLLPDMSREEVLKAILLPTSETEYDDTGSAFEHFRFKFEDGVAEHVRDELFESVQQGGGGVLPVMQIACRHLYESVRKGSKPWVIDKALYSKAPLEVSIKGHVTKSLRLPLLPLFNNKEADTCKEEQRWRKILYDLIRYEGDGRVSTKFMSHDAFSAKMKELGVVAELDGMLEYLTRPEVLLLRRVSVSGAAPGSADAMFGLGHDVVALALSSMKSQDDANERDAKRQRQRRCRFYGALLASFLVAGFGFLYYLERKSERDELWKEEIAKVLAEERQKIDAGISSAKKSYKSDPARALQSAKEAVLVAEKLKAALLLKKAQDTVELLEAAMPTHKLEVADDSIDVAVHALLDSHSGFASVSMHSNGLIEVRPLAGQPGGKPAQHFQLRGGIDIRQQSTLTASEPFPGQILILLSSNDPESKDGVRDFKMFLLMNGTIEPKGPYTGNELLKKYAVRAFTDQKQRKKVGESNLSAVTLGGNIISLTHGNTDQGGLEVVTLVLDPYSKGDFFSPSISHSLEAEKKRVQEYEFPPSVTQQIIGDKLVSVRYSSTKQRLVTQFGQLESLEASALRDGNDGHAWHLQLKSIPGVAKCRKDDIEACAVSLFSGTDHLKLLRVSFLKEQDNYGPLEMKETDASYVAVDTNSGKFKEVSAAIIEAVKTTCDRVEFQKSDTVSQSPEILTFVDGTLDDLLFVYKRSAAIKLVRIKNDQVACSEHLIPNLKVESWQWRYSPNENLLLAMSGQELFAWKLGVPKVPTETLAQPAPATIQGSE